MKKLSKGKKLRRASALRREIKNLLPILTNTAAKQLGRGLDVRILSERGPREKDILMSEEQEPMKLMRKDRRTLPDLNLR